MPNTTLPSKRQRDVVQRNIMWKIVARMGMECEKGKLRL